MMKSGPKARRPAKAAVRRPVSSQAGGVDGFDARSWAGIPAAFRSSGALFSPWTEIFAPLREGTVDDLMVVGQFGQSIDARIATATGQSHYINGAAGLAHLHRLRALVDAVVIGVGTAIADDPQLTVRHVTGPSPARVVIDPNGRLPARAKVLAADGVRRLVLTGKRARVRHSEGIEVVRLAGGGHIAPPAILSALAAQGFRRILIEGGADTISRFLAAGCLDRLHVVIAPIFIGAGRSSVTLPPIDHVNEALRTKVYAHSLGQEVLLDCDLSTLRKPLSMLES